MKMRRVLIQLEVETNVTLYELKSATLTIHRAHHVSTEVNAKRLAEENLAVIRYLEANRVNVIRESTKKRGKRK